MAADNPTKRQRRARCAYCGELYERFNATVSDTCPRCLNIWLRTLDLGQAAGWSGERISACAKESCRGIQH